ncbi:hypothetical protein [Nocardioides terrisoli]|uniref:hypothetical protein n=1 Tax=Nocardioides terrisoli TaxID=3388267 RepID=UPI00287B6B3C|nr:hypothetical protein [Nocardioides marmorisolisilvae]
MSFTVFVRTAYSDVFMLASTDQEAPGWFLEVDDDRAGRWLRLDAMIGDSYLNWSTPDLSIWHDLRSGDPSVAARVFPNASPGAPAHPPFMVAWDVSHWIYLVDEPYRFRFVDPHGQAYEFEYQSVASSSGNGYTLGEGHR